MAKLERHPSSQSSIREGRGGSSKTNTAAQVERILKSLGTPERAKSSAWFFKTGVGQYGHGDVFAGVTVPEQRKVARQFRDLPLAEIDKLLANKIHECRLTALLVLVGQYQKADATACERIVQFYLAHTSRINNWDLVDSSASYILGLHLLYADEKKRKILYRLAKSKDLWERRIAIIATLAFIVRANDYADTLALAELLLSDTHDLIHKATGWMLREVGKRSPETLRGFLRTRANQMPRTMLRYAIERFPEGERKGWLKTSANLKGSASSPLTGRGSR